MSNLSIEPRSKKNILFICTGNKFRSPSADHILKAIAPDLHVKSAGTSKSSAGSHLIAKKMRRCLVEIGYTEPSLRSQHVSRDLLEWADVVFYVAPTHLKYLDENFPEFNHKYYGLYKFHPEKNLNRIEDPAFIQPHDEVLAVTKIIEECVIEAKRQLNL